MAKNLMKMIGSLIKIIPDAMEASIGTLMTVGTLGLNKESRNIAEHGYRGLGTDISEFWSVGEMDLTKWRDISSENEWPEDRGQGEAPLGTPPPPSGETAATIDAAEELTRKRVATLLTGGGGVLGLAPVVAPQLLGGSAGLLGGRTGKTGRVLPTRR